MSELEMNWGGKPMSETVKELQRMRRATDAGGGCFHPKEHREAARYAYLHDEQICTAYLELLAKAEKMQAELKGRKP